MDEDIKSLADAIYGEMAGQDYQSMLMVGSTALNRLTSGRHNEFGSDLNSVLEKGYYAVSKNSPQYRKAVKGNFKTNEEIGSYQQAVDVASGLLRGNIKPMPGHFYFTDDEMNKLKDTPKKFNFKIVHPSSKIGKYTVFSY